MGRVKTKWEPCVFQGRPSVLLQKAANGDICFFTERDWSQECYHGNNIIGVILFFFFFFVHFCCQVWRTLPQYFWRYSWFSAFNMTRLLPELRQVLSCEWPAVFLHTPLEEKEPWGPFYQLWRVIAKGRHLLQILLKALWLSILQFKQSYFWCHHFPHLHNTKNLNISKTNKDIPKRKTPFFLTL